MSNAPALVIGADLTGRLIELATSAVPHEACAILSGPDRAIATRLHPARNALASPYRYDVDPADLVRIVTAIEDAGEELVAIFHSHPHGPAVPSATDLRESRYDVVHLVAGRVPAPWALRAWRLADGRAIEVTLSATAPG